MKNSGIITVRPKSVNGDPNDCIIPLWGVTAKENQFAQRVCAGEEPIKVVREIFPEHDDKYNPKENQWIRNRCTRWMKSQRVQDRIAAISAERKRREIVSQQGMTDRLTDIVDTDFGDYWKQDENGFDVQKSLSELTPEQRKKIKGLDKNGNYVLLDKELALNRIIKINGLESINVSVHIGGKLGELLGGGAKPQLPMESVSVIESKINSSDAEDAEVIEDDFSNL